MAGRAGGLSGPVHGQGRSALIAQSGLQVISLELC